MHPKNAETSQSDIIIIVHLITIITKCRFEFTYLKHAIPVNIELNFCK